MGKNKGIKNKGKSIRDRLLILSREASYDYNLMLTRYAQERMLYRLSQSKYRNQFLLKGGALLYAYNQLKSRPTVDIDFLARNLNNDKENIKSVFKEILAIQADDALTFDEQKITVEDIMGRLAYPVILGDMPSFDIKAYSLETVVAEKFHTMIDLSIYNSRMKDFFDLYTILSTKELNSAVLTEAVKATFENRHTEYAENHALFTEEFFLDGTKTNQWNSFLQKIKHEGTLTFSDVGKIIREKMKPFWQSLAEKE